MTASSYDADLSNAEWAILAPLLVSTTRGCPRKHDLRLALNAILYILRGGEPWRLLPHSASLDRLPMRLRISCTGKGSWPGPSLVDAAKPTLEEHLIDPLRWQH